MPHWCRGVGQRLHIVGRGRANNLWPTQCFLNLLSMFKLLSSGPSTLLSVHTQWFSALTGPWHYLGSSQANQITIAGGGAPLAVSPDYYNVLPGGEPQLHNLNTEPGHTGAVPAWQQRHIRLFSFLSWVCSSNSSPATLYANVGLVFLIYWRLECHNS